MTNQTYEEWLMTYGIKSQEVELHKPELIRYTRSWSYPSNTVDPITGTPSSAVSWSIAERADKDRFFKEPGFIVGVTTTRPKVYLSKQTGSMSGFMNDVYSWLPATLRGNQEFGWRKLTTTVGPLASQAADYWVDIHDLFVYGDQYVNFSLASTDAGLVALPTAALQKRYPTQAETRSLFTDNVVKMLVRQDGIVNLGIASTTKDVTPTVNES